VIVNEKHSNSFPEEIIIAGNLNAFYMEQTLSPTCKRDMDGLSLAM